MIDILKDIKRQAKDIIAKNKVLFIPSIIVIILDGIVSITKPFWTDYCNPSLAFIISQLSIILLFPLSIGYIKTLLQVKEGQSFKIRDMLSIYLSPELLLKLFGLIMITDGLISIATFINTNFIQEFLKIHNMAFVSAFLWFALFIIDALIYLYLFLTNYLLILKPELNLIQIITQSISLIKGKVIDLMWLTFSFFLWYTPLIIILGKIALLKIKLSPQYFIYYGIYYLYYGCIMLYITLTFLLFAQKIIDGEDYASTPISVESKVLDYYSVLQDIHFNSKISEDDEELKIEDYFNEALENKRIQFENDKMLSSEVIVLTDTVENLKSYNIELRYDNFELYYFFKEYGKIRNLFVKTYNEVAYYYDSDNLENTAEDNISLNNNDFRLVVSINQNSSNNNYEIKFELFINQT